MGFRGPEDTLRSRQWGEMEVHSSNMAMTSGPPSVWLPDVDVALEHVVIASHCGVSCC